MPESIKKDVAERMDKAIANLKRELAALRSGRATPTLLDRIHVEYYGSLTPINQLANINTPDSRTLIIQPWDKSIIGAVEKAIMKSDLGITPSNDGTAIRIGIPLMTEERRTELVKMSKKVGEESKVAVRNIRRDANEEIKRLEKQGISEDESRRHQEDIQKSTDKSIVEIEKILDAKEKEIMEV